VALRAPPLFGRPGCTLKYPARVDIVDAHHHLLDLRRLAYPWIEVYQPVLTASLPN
jgi:hypothetical protein